MTFFCSVRNVGIVIGILLTVILVLAVGIFYVVYRNKKGVGSKSTPTHSLITRKFTDRFSNPIEYKVNNLESLCLLPEPISRVHCFSRITVCTLRTVRLPRCPSTDTILSRTTSRPQAKPQRPLATPRPRRPSMRSRCTTGQTKGRKCTPRREDS